MASRILEPPRTTSQSSRKGKKAWRKNVDIADVTQSLQAARDDEAITGVRGQVLADLPAERLFTTDVAGSEQIRAVARRTHGTTLKVDEILAQRSKVPGVGTRKRAGENAKTTDGIIVKKQRTGGGVKPSELQRLQRIAYGGEGRGDAVTLAGETAITHDPWAEEASEAPEVSEKLSFIEKPKPIRAPKTLKEAPRSLTASGKSIPNVRLPNAGRSYNPLFEDWQNLLVREGDKELAAEKKRLKQAEAEQERLDRIALIAEQEERAEDEADMSAYESEWEGIQSDVEDAQLTKKRPERKTPAERNKAKRRVEAKRLAKHEARMLAREAQAKKIDELRKVVEEKENALKQRKAVQLAAEPQEEDDVHEDEDDSEGERELNRRAKKRGRVLDAPLELVLPDELQDSLRRLKPEGNLLRDRYRNAVVQGRTEARRPLSMQRKARRKATEKWSYKDWRLPSQGPRTVA